MLVAGKVSDLLECSGPCKPECATAAADSIESLAVAVRCVNGGARRRPFGGRGAQLALTFAGEVKVLAISGFGNDQQRRMGWVS